MNLHTIVILPGFLLFEIPRMVTSTCSAAIVLFLIGIFAVKDEFAEERGLDKIVALANLCFAIPLAVFGAEHFAAAQGISTMVPKFVPWHLFWAYFVGFALVAAGLSIATKILVQWSGLLFGAMMFLFVAMMDLPGALADRHNRIAWILLFRELSFGAGGWVLAATAMSAQSQGRRMLVTIGRIVIGATAMFYGVEHFLYPVNAPGVPLEKIVPTWIPARPFTGYLTGVILLVAGAAILLLAKKTRMAATYLGSWILLLVVFLYGPILISSLMDPSTAVKVEGINYFFDTLLYAGTILGLARATARTD